MWARALLAKKTRALAVGGHEWQCFFNPTLTPYSITPTVGYLDGFGS
jgi:hypothetical protein